MSSRTEYNTQKPKNFTLFSGQYLRNHWTLDIGVLGYIGIVWHKEHSPEVRSFPPGTPSILRPEIRFFYVKKQALNERLYRIHLECAKIWNSLWQYMPTCISQYLNLSADNLYPTLNRKLNNICEQYKNSTNKEQLHTQTILLIIHTYRICNEWTAIMKRLK